ncbi:MAG: hypothetical protein M1836_007438 [Candelina mexicana]|nr:MAG: hypothetical protein M1836_007438 [Candelina mexicana]
MILIGASGLANLNFSLLPVFTLCFISERPLSTFPLAPSRTQPPLDSFLSPLLPPIRTSQMVLFHPVASLLPFPTTFRAVSGSANATIRSTVPPKMTSAQKTHSKPPLPNATHPPITGPKQTAKLAAPCVGPRMEPRSAGGDKSAATPKAIASTAEAPRLCKALNINEAA